MEKQSSRNIRRNWEISQKERRKIKRIEIQKIGEREKQKIILKKMKEKRNWHSRITYWQTQEIGQKWEKRPEENTIEFCIVKALDSVFTILSLSHSLSFCLLSNTWQHSIHTRPQSNCDYSLALSFSTLNISFVVSLFPHSCNKQIFATELLKFEEKLLFHKRRANY